MTRPQPLKRFTPEEYYLLERDAAYKSDYYDGEIFAMAGGTSRHSIIAVNIAGELRQQLKGRPCAPYESNQRLKVNATGLRVYPDVSVYCGPLEYDERDSGSETATNPTLLFEVLSRSTEAYDRGFKAENYRRIATLRAYVLVSQESPHVEVYERQSDDSWIFREEKELGAVIPLSAIGVTLALREIYDRIEFPISVTPPRPGRRETD
jgi:Uma2 family endonuclease